MSEPAIVTEEDLRREFAKQQACVEAVELVAPGSIRVVVSLRSRSWDTDPALRLARLRETLRARKPLGLVFEVVLHGAAGPYRTPGGGG